jgi:predicted secreted protein
MSADTLQPAPDWFDAWWDANQAILPIWMRGQKKAARQVLAGVIQGLGQYAQTPEGVKQIIAFARITAMVKSIGSAMTTPDPSPDDVVDAVQRLLNRVKP